jgi:transcriptional repressor NrdR
MRCPFCGFEETQVKDSRPTEDGTSIRRRRACPECGGRFTTFERIQLRDLVVVKAGDRRQNFDRDKITRSMEIALRKRPVTADQIEKSVNSIVRQLETSGEMEIPSKHIGDLVMQALIQLDMVGFIRYASVYKDFSTPEDFNSFVRELTELQVSRSDSAE